MLGRASDWVNTICRQVLAATTDQEQVRVRPNRQGQLELYPKNFPIIELLSAQWTDLASFAASAPTPVAVTDAAILDRSILIYDRCYLWWRGWGRFPLIVQYQYTNGYAHTTVTGPAAGTSQTVPAGATTLTVADATGIGGSLQGSALFNLSSELVILDGAAGETVEVQAVNGATLTLVSPTVNSHQVGALISGVPQAVQQWTIDLAAYLIKTRGLGGVEFTDKGFGGEKSAQGSAEGLGLEPAFDRLIPYTRVGAA